MNLLKPIKLKNILKIPTIKNKINAKMRPEYAEGKGDTSPKRNHLKTFFLIKKFTSILKLKVSMKKMNQLNSKHFSIIGDKASNGNPYQELREYQIYRKQNKCKQKIKAFIAKIQHILPKLQLFIAEKVPVFEPDRPFFLFMDCFLLVYLILIIAQTFLKLSFHLKREHYTEFWWIVFEELPPYIFFLETLIKLNTSYYHKGIYIQNRYKILKHYLKYEFFLDVVTLLPLFLSLSEFSEYLDLLFTMRIVLVESILKRIDDYLQLRGKKEGIFQLMKLIANLFFLAHLSACFWHYLAQYEISCDFDTNWLKYRNIETDPWLTRYTYSMYFAIVTMMTVGYGDITGQNQTEVFFNIIIIVYGCAVFAYTINDIGVIFKEMYQEEKAFKKKIKVISDYMKKRGLNRVFQMKVKKYLEYMFEENKNNFRDNSFIKDSLSSTLRDEMQIELYSRYIKSNRILNSNFSDTFLTKLSLVFNEITFGPDDNIELNSEDNDLQLYFVLKGEIELYLKDGQKIKSIGTKKKGCSFGELSFITASPKKSFARCNSVTHMAFIRRSDFLKLLNQFPSDYEKFCILRDEILLYQNLSVLQQKCLSCKSEHHFLINCPLINYKPDKQLIVKKHNISEFQERDPSFSRHKKKNIHWKKDLSEMKLKAFDIHAKFGDDLTSHGAGSSFEMQDQEEELEEEEEEEKNSFEKLDILEPNLMNSPDLKKRKNSMKPPENNNNNNIPENINLSGHNSAQLRKSSIKPSENQSQNSKAHDFSPNQMLNVSFNQIESPSLKSPGTRNLQKFKNLSVKIEKQETLKSKNQLPEQNFPLKSRKDISPLINDEKAKEFHKKITGDDQKSRNEFGFAPNENFFEIKNFEIGRNYQYYYPHNNLSHIIKHLKRKKSKRKVSPRKSMNHSANIFSALFRKSQKVKPSPNNSKKFLLDAPSTNIFQDDHSKAQIE